MEKAVQLASGNWRQRVTDPTTGKRHSVTAPGPTDRKVRKAAALLLAELQTKAAAKTPAQVQTRFDLYAEQYLFARRPDEVDGYAPSVFYKRQHHLRELNKTFGALHIEDITPLHVRAWWNSKASTPSQRQSLYNLAHTILAQAVDDELIVRDPFRIKGAGKESSKPRPNFTDADMEKLYAATEDPQMRVILLVLMGTALRIGELLALDWEDIEFFDAKLHVVKHLTPQGMAEGTKGGKHRTRRISLTPWVLDALMEMFEESDGEGAIFRNARGGRMSIDGVEVRFRKIRERAGLPNVHIHDIRHRALTNYGQQPGVTLADIMAHGGHLKPQVAMRYQHADDDRADTFAKGLRNPLRSVR